MGVRLVYDERLVVHDVQTFTLAAPYPMCPEADRALQSIKGLRMSQRLGPRGAQPARRRHRAAPT